MRLELLSAIGKVLGIQFKVDGVPYGAEPLIEPGDSSLSTR
jgi:hypothetical protein